MKMAKLIEANIFIENIGTNDQRENLKEQSKLFQKTNISLSNTNFGCWRGEIQYKNIEWLENKIIENLEKVMEYYKIQDKSYSKKLEEKYHYIETWTNINLPNSSNRIHTHKSFDFVAVYFIQGTDTGTLTFHNPANLLTDCSGNSPFTSRFSFEPKDGDLFIWPAWMPHEVDINLSNKERINIAFNIKI